MAGEPPEAPRYDSLPSARNRLTRVGPDTGEISLTIEVTTPIFGGAVAPRTIDEVDVIRAPSIRGNLRFWWRALNGHRFESSEELFEKESELWGRAAEDHGGRSKIEIRVVVLRCGSIDEAEVELYDSKRRGVEKTPGAYALWPARSEKQSNLPPAPRRQPGTRFKLTLILPHEYRAETQDAIRAWLLFGGYGGRTRRGLGSLRALDGAEAWLPREISRDDLQRLFGRDVFQTPNRPATDVPWLAGAALYVGKAFPDAQSAWTTALDWLDEFRQGTGGKAGERAREPGTGKPQPQRPSVSNWPEADKIRHLTGKTKAHPPRHNCTPVWPRGGFGLPIVGQFQTQGRQKGTKLNEPRQYQLHWREPDPDAPSDYIEHDRLASPLIVKALALAGGKFVPVALWLNRAYPEEGEIVLKGIGRSGAPFDRLVAPGDKALFSALSNKATLQQAFLDWLVARNLAQPVVP